MLLPFSRSKSSLKTGIANPLDGSGDDKVWDDSSDEESDEVKEILPSSLVQIILSMISMPPCSCCSQSQNCTCQS